MKSHYDPNQPRDEYGRWTRVGIKRLVTPEMVTAARKAFRPEVWATIEEMADRDDLPVIRGVAAGLVAIGADYPHVARDVDYVEHMLSRADHHAACYFDDREDGRGKPYSTVEFAPFEMTYSYKEFTEQGRMRSPKRFRDEREARLKHSVSFKHIEQKPTPEAYGYTIAVHEMGHFAHLHAAKVYAVEQGWDNTHDPDSYYERNEDIFNLGGVPMPLPSSYAQANRAEHFAEFFASYYLGNGHNLDAVQAYMDKVFPLLDKPWPKKGRKR